MEIYKNIFIFQYFYAMALHCKNQIPKKNKILDKSYIKIYYVRVYRKRLQLFI